MTLIASTILALLAVAYNPSMMGAAAAFLIVILVGLGRREKEVINPYYLFLSTPISLLLYSDTVSQIFLPPIEEEVQLIIVGAIFAYLAGLLSYGGVGRTFKAKPSLAYHFYIILGFGIIPHLAGAVTNGFPLLAGDVNASRENYFLPVIGQFTVFLPVAMLIAFRRKDRSLIILSVALNAFLSAMVVSRFSIMFSALFFFYGYFRYDGKSSLGIRPSHLVAAAAISIPFLFEAIFAARESASQTAYAWRRELEFGSVFLNTYGDYTYLPYIYLTAPWSNFSYLFEVRTEMTYGARSIYSIASFLQIEQFLNFEPRVVRNATFNTHAFPADFYLDFGVLGVVLLSFLLGFLVKWSYIAAQKSSDVLQEAIWMSFAFASFMLFFSNHFTGLSYPLISLVLFSVYRFVRRLARARPQHQRA